MAGRLAGKVAIITGAGSGIGRAAAELFAAEGARVMCADIDEKGARETVESINKSSAKAAIASKVDVTLPADQERMVAQTVAAFGGVDVLYANAGIGHAASAIDLSVEDWSRMIGINLTGVWLSCKYALPHMVKAGRGSIINQSSTAGLIGIAGLPHYSAAKAGVIGLTRQLAVEYGPKGIRANAICPSTIPTPLVMKVWETRAAAAGGTKPVADQLAAQVAATGSRYPLGRLGELRDCTQAALFLASDESSWITGVAVPLDGGLTAG